MQCAMPPGLDTYLDDIQGSVSPDPGSLTNTGA
ncbi:hypothetical protein QFZ58_001574 [Streptomyces sp. B1I3]|nr:hypothetical protein [Streptomyces sp. B1I3]